MQLVVEQLKEEVEGQPAVEQLVLEVVERL